MTRLLDGLTPPTDGCECECCIVLRGRLRDGAEFVLRDTEPPKAASRARGTPEFEEIRRRVQAELGKSIP